VVSGNKSKLGLREVPSRSEGAESRLGTPQGVSAAWPIEAMQDADQWPAVLTHQHEHTTKGAILMTDADRRARMLEERRLQERMYEMKRAWMDARGLAETSGRVCPNRLVGERHKGSKYDGFHCSACRGFGHSGILDHPYGFYKKGNGYQLECIVTHPYQYFDSDIREIEQLCAKLELRYEILPQSESWYRQGATFMVVMTRAEKINAE